MKHFMWLLRWVLKAAIFFTLFAFALNNQQDTTVHFFFGTQWRAPQVLVVQMQRPGFWAEHTPIRLDTTWGRAEARKPRRMSSRVKSGFTSSIRLTTPARIGAE